MSSDTKNRAENAEDDCAVVHVGIDATQESSDEETDDMDDFIDYGGGDCIVDEKKCRRVCKALKRNDPKTTRVETARLGGVYLCGKQIGEALRGNTHVTRLDLNLSNSSGRHFEPDSVTLEMALLLQYLEEGPALRFVRLSGREGNESLLTGPVLRAIARHSHLEVLTIDDEVQIDDEDFAHLLRTTMSLKTLHMYININSLVVEEAFGANRSLETIRFVGFDQIQDMTFLRHLRAHPALQCLEFADLSSEQMDVLTEYLKQTEGLTYLKLRDQYFDRTRVRYVIEGLETNRSLTHISLEHCIFDTGTIEPLHAMLRSTMRDGDGGGGPAAVSPISHLEFQYYYRPGHGTDQAAALLVLICRKHLKVCSLTGNRHDCVGEFWRTIEAHSSHVEGRLLLQTMKLADLPTGGPDGLALCSCLPLLPTLQELCMNGLQRRRPMSSAFIRRFARAVCQSGSLRDVTVAGNFPMFWSEAETRLVKAALERNRVLPELLSSTMAPTNEAEFDEKKPLAPSIPVLQAPSKLFPDLFMSATASPSVTPNSITKGLLSLSEGIGVGDAVGKKRS